MHDDADLVPIDVMSIPDKLPVLGKGGHSPGSNTPCAMEAASWLADEPWSAAPRAVHPVIAAVARAVNDSVTDAERQELWPLILASIGTSRRHHMLLQWRLRHFAKRLLRGPNSPNRAAWEAVLIHFAELTGKDPSFVPQFKVGDLETRITFPFTDGSRY